MRRHVDKIICSRFFARSVRLSRFLRFTTEHALAGTSEQVKEYLVGVEVFDRKPDYDPRVDPIVRVEARRLRTKLKAYYSADGRTDDLVIDYPKGAYTPIFRQPSATQPAAKPAAVPSAMAGIVVLPFDNLTVTPKGSYFSDGLAEELIHLLTRVAGLRVVAWHSAAKLRGQEQDYAALRDQLKVDRVLRGSVRLTGSRVRVAAQLVDCLSGDYLWSEVYDRDLADVFAIQSDIACAIVATLRLTLAPAVRPHVNLEVYDLCLQGRFHANKRTPEGLRLSVRTFDEAIALDPQSALAYSCLADSYGLLAAYGLMRPREIVPQAEGAARRALELDPNSAEAYTSLALITSFYHWRWSEAEDLYKRAIQLNPGYATAHHWYGSDHLLALGRFEEAAIHIEAAQQLDPLSHIIQDSCAFICLFRRDYQRSIALYRGFLVDDPSFYRWHSSLGRALIQAGQYDEAIENLLVARKLAPAVPSILGALGQALGLAGRRDEALGCIDDLAKLGAGRYVPSTCFAIAHLGLGETGKALDWLERSYEQHEFPIGLIGTHPVYDPLRGNPRFQKILRQISLP